MQVGGSYTHQSLVLLHKDFVAVAGVQLLACIIGHAQHAFHSLAFVFHLQAHAAELQLSCHLTSQHAQALALV